MTDIRLPEFAWVKKEGNISTIGIDEKLHQKIGSVIDINFPEPGMELLPGEPILKISGTDDDFVLNSTFHGYYLAKNEDSIDLYHFNNENWLIKVEVKPNGAA